MTIKAGSVVKLKPSVRHICPEGRDDNLTAKVRAVLSEGRLVMAEDLRGCKYWNANDVDIAKPE